MGLREKSLNKSGIVKITLLIGLLLFFMILFIIFFDSKISSAIIQKNKYVIGENVKINLIGTDYDKLKIITPKTSYMISGKKDGFIFKPEQMGSYKIIAYSKSGNKEFLFDVISKEQYKNENNSSLINSNSNDSNPIIITQEIIRNNSKDDIEKTDFSSFSEMLNYTSEKYIIINKDVKWEYEENITDSRSNLKIKIPSNAKNISAYSVTKNGRRKVDLKIDKNRISNSIGGVIGNDTPSGYATIDTIEGNSKLEIEYYTEGPKSHEKEISKKEKEIVVKSENGLHYKNVLGYTNISEIIKSNEQILIYWEEEDEYLDFMTYDEDKDGFIDIVTWIIPHLSEQTFRIIIITKAEHLDEDRNFISDIYETVRSQDGIYSEEIKDKEYVRVEFETNLTNGNDITIFPKIISGKPEIYVYEKNGNRKITEFKNIQSEKYNSIYFKNLKEPTDSFDLRVIGGSVEIDYIVDPYFNNTINTDASSTATGTTGTSFIGGKNIIRLNSGRLIAYFEDGSNDASCSDSTDGGVSWSAYSSLAGTHGDLAIASNGSNVVYTMTEEGQNDFNFVYRTTAVCDVASGSNADVNAATNNNFRADIAFNGIQNLFVACTIERTTLDMDFARAPVLGTLTWTGSDSIGGSHTLSMCSLDVDSSGGTFVAVLRTNGIQVFNSSNNFSSITNTSVYDTGVNNLHLSARGNELLISGVDTNSDLVIINSSQRAIFSSNVFAGTFSEAEGCIDSNGNFNIIIGDGADLYFIQYRKTFFSNIFLVENTPNAIRYPSVRCSNYPTSNRMTDGQLDIVYTQLTSNDVYYANYTLLDDVGRYGNPSVSIVNPQNITYSTTTPFVPFNFTLNEYGSCYYSLNTGTTNVSMNANSSFSHFNGSNSTIADGFYTINAYCNDSVNEQNFTTSQTFWIDKTLPRITILSPSGINYSTTTIGFNVTLSENGTWCGYSLDGSANVTVTNFNNTNFNFSNSTMSQGYHSVVFACNDTYGNMNSSSGVRVFGVDTIVPAVSILDPANTTISRSTIYFNISANEPSTCVYSLNNGVTNISMSTNLSNTGFNGSNGSIADGSYIVRAYCNDSSVSNWNRTTTRSFVKDTLGPSVIFISPTANIEYNTSSILINISAQDNSGISLRWYGYNGVNYTYTTFGYFNFTNGNHTLYAYANDTIGNFNYTSINFSVQIPPLLLFTFNNGTNLTYSQTILSSSNGLYNIRLDINRTNIGKIYFYEFNTSANQTFIFSGTTNETYGVDSFAISTEGMSYSSMNLSFTANGSYFSKCTDWNMTTLICNDPDNWDVLFTTEIGSEYNISLNATDPGFVEYNVASGDVLNDGYASEGSSTTEWGARTVMIVANYTGNNQHPLVMFNISNLPRGVIIDVANLTLRCSAETLEASESIGVGVHYVYSNYTWTEGNGGNGGNPCTEGEYCWAFRPNATTNFNPVHDSFQQIPDSCSGINYTFSVINSLQYALDQNYKNVSFLFKPNGTNVGTITNDVVQFSTRQASNNLFGPKLNITYHSIPQVIKILPISGFEYNSSQIVTIRVNVTDALLNVSVRANVTSPDGISNVFNLTNFTGNIFEINYTNTESLGRYNITFLANNTDGYLNSTEKTFFLVAETIAPNISLIDPTQNSSTLRRFNNFIVNVSAQDPYFRNISVYLYNSTTLLNTSSGITNPYSINFTNLIDGLYFFNATSCDLFNNCNFTETRNVTIDTLAPNLSIISPLGLNYSVSSILVNISNSSDASYIWYFNGSANETYNSGYSGVSRSFPDGYTTLIGYANDSAGNINQTSILFLVDTIYPNVTYGDLTDINYANVSRNWTLINVSVIEVHESNVTFNIFNSSHNLVNMTTLQNGSRYLNFSNLYDGLYYYNVTVTDLANNRNWTSTRVITIDTISPSANLTFPYNGTYYSNRTQNFTVNVSDNIGINNLTLRIYNSSNSIVNISTRSVNGQYLLYGLIVALPYDDNFTWSYEARDVANGYNLTLNNSVFIDTLNPSINYTNPTLSNGTIIEQDTIFVNISGSDSNFENITFELYNVSAGYQLVNRTIFSVFTESVNWTNLSSLNVTYAYNVTIYDKANNKNSTESRYIKLADLTNPSLTIIEPQNRTYYQNNSLDLIFSVFDLNLDSCWYNIDNDVNISVPDCNNTLFNVSEGAHTLYFYVNDSIGLYNNASVTFVANESLAKFPGGILVYGEGTLQSPRYRYWNGTGFDEQNSMPGVGGTIEWTRAKTSPSRDEYIVVIANSLDDVSVQMNSTLPNGTTCWNNGTDCNYGINLTLTASTINRLKADVAYETTGEDAVVVWNENNITAMYKVWNGSYWSESREIPQNFIGSGVISYMKMISHPYSEEISLIMTNTSALTAIVWNGTSWGCEPSTYLSLNVTPDVYQHADLAYEQESGDLFIAATQNGPTDIYYIEKQNGSCTYTRTHSTLPSQENEIVSLGSKYESNFIGISLFDIANNEFAQGLIWNGTDIINASGTDTQSLSETSPFLPISFAWAGTTKYGLLTYADFANNNIDYFRYNLTDAVWEGGATGADATGLTAMTGSEQSILSLSYIDQNRSLFIIGDDSNDLWVKGYNGDTNTWFEPDRGTTLNANIASTPMQSFFFEFDNDRGGPSITIIMPRTYYQNVSEVYINVTLGEDGLSCTYSVDGGVANGLSQENLKTFSVISLMQTEGDHNVSFTCLDTLENSRSKSTNFFVDTVYPQVNFTNLTLDNGTIIEQNWIFVNVSVYEINEANITFNLYSSTHSLLNSSTLIGGSRNINWTGLSQGIYYYNVSVTDFSTNTNYSETRAINLSYNPPVISLLSPTNHQNITNLYVLQFNYTVSDNSSLINCSLYANYSGSFLINYTTLTPSNNGSLIQNFSSANTTRDGYNLWNVRCTDILNQTAFASSNFTFSTFIFPDFVKLFNISQFNNEGTGNISLFWNESNHTTSYNIYYSSNLATNFIYLNSTTSLNYTDNSFNGSLRRFYRIDSLNPIGQNSSSLYFGVHVYQLSHLANVNTRNWISFPSNASYLTTANQTLNEIRNATAFTMWNSTLQKRVTCNKFSCPDVLSCTASNCNFNFTNRQGYGYEVNINSSVPANINWSLVGYVNLPQQLFLEKNVTNFGKNWIGIQANTSLQGAGSLLQNISNSDAVSRWNAQLQTSQGLIPSPFPFGNPYIGTNFSLTIEQGYEVSVTTNVTWRQK